MKIDERIEMIIELAKKTLQYPKGTDGFDASDKIRLAQAVKSYEKESVNIIDNWLFKNGIKKTKKEVKLRTDLIEFLEANNYFLNSLETKENAINVVDTYVKYYK